VVGWLYNHIDPRLLIAFGVALIVWSFHDLAHLSADIEFWTLTPILVIMGLGMPFQFVTLTTVSISTVPRESMTSASSIYTLSRRVGGNIGYALLATVVARRSQFHRATLIKAFTPTNPVFTTASAQLAAGLTQRGVPPTFASQKATALLDGLLNQQCGIMAYNDAAWFVALIFLLSTPLILLFPGRTVPPPAEEVADVESMAG
jgi:DHA2 family multidrug resistance protein